jgi:hypothetical protein
MEPSWTEPPPFTWVVIGADEHPECRRQSDEVALCVPERCWPLVRGCESEHLAQGRGIVRSEQGR